MVSMNLIILLVVMMDLANKQANDRKLNIIILRYFFVIATRNAFCFYSFTEVMIALKSYLIQKYKAIKKTGNAGL